MNDPKVRASGWKIVRSDRSGPARDDFGVAGGGTTEACGWLRDRYGSSGLIVPAGSGEMMSDADRARSKRVADAMLKMVTFDIAALEAAYAGTTAEAVTT